VDYVVTVRARNTYGAGAFSYNAAADGGSADVAAPRGLSPTPPTLQSASLDDSGVVTIAFTPVGSASALVTLICMLCSLRKQMSL
jgi:hypothetical protein